MPRYKNPSDALLAGLGGGLGQGIPAAMQASYQQRTLDRQAQEQLERTRQLMGEQARTAALYSDASQRDIPFGDLLLASKYFGPGGPDQLQMDQGDVAGRSAPLGSAFPGGSVRTAVPGAGVPESVASYMKLATAPRRPPTPRASSAQPKRIEDWWTKFSSNVSREGGMRTRMRGTAMAPNDPAYNSRLIEATGSFEDFMQRKATPEDVQWIRSRLTQG